MDDHEEYNLYNDVFRIIIGNRIFNSRVEKYYLGLTKWNKNINKEKILKTVTAAALAGNNRLIDKIVEFYTDIGDIEMLNEINEVREIGG